MSDSDPQTPPRPPEPPRRFSWTKLLLAISLGLNFIVIGFVAGRVLDGGDGDRRYDPRPSQAARELGIGPYVDALTDRERRALGRDIRREVMRNGGPGEFRARLRESFADVLVAIRAEPFDPAALSALLDAQSDAAESRRRLGQDALVAHLAAMSEDQRAAFADRLEARLTRRPKR